ncbi:MAG: hypothetical protein JWN53_24 [Gemmatimonadetes bacterium]|jgi:hypothetical protein|nr:hypothetical protein [Gemmatimonadota bacterium]
MLDLLYLLGTLGFFALMLAYVSFCERLGHSRDAAEDAPEPTP